MSTKSEKRHRRTVLEQSEAFYESPDEEEDEEGDMRANKILATRVATEKIQYFLNRKQKTWFCNRCKKHIATNQKHMRCFECLDYELCLPCYKFLGEKKRIHKHNNNYFFFPMKEPYFALPDRLRDLEDEELSMKKVLSSCFKEYKDRFFVGQREPTDKFFRYITYGEFEDGCWNVLDSLKKKTTLAPQDCICMVCDIHLEYLYLYFASLMGGFIFVPVQPILTTREKQHVIFQAEAKVILCTSKYFEEVNLIASKKSDEKMFVVTISENSSSEPQEGTKLSHVTYIDFSELLVVPTVPYTKGKIPYSTSKKLTPRKGRVRQKPKPKKSPFSSVSKKKKKKTSPISKKKKNVKDADREYYVYGPSDICLLVYTSGSTGSPKGIVFRRTSFLRDILMRKNSTFPLVRLSFVPFSNKSGMYNIFITFFMGGRTGMLTNNCVSYLEEDFQILRVTSLNLVPRMMNHIYNEFHKQCEEELNKNCKNRVRVNNSKLPYKDRVLRSMEGVFGTRLTEVIVGSAKSSVRVKRFIRKLTGLPVIDGYGLSELGSVLGNWHKIEGNEYKVIDVPELGYLLTDKPNARGELCVKNRLSENLEYFKEKELTESKFDKDGFFHTGDIVEIHKYLDVKSKEERERIVVIDRKNNVVKLAQGQFVSFESIEAVLQSCCDGIDQALVFPNKEKTRIFGMVLPVVCDNKEKKEEEFVKKEIMREIGKMNGKIPSWQLPVDVLLVEDFEFTELKKKKRRVMLMKHERELQLMFKKNSILCTVLEVLENKVKEGEEGEVSSLSFRDLGGDSLSAVFFLTKMKGLGIQISYDELMNKSIGELMKGGSSNEFEGITKKRNGKRLFESFQEGDSEYSEEKNSFVTLKEEKQKMRSFLESLAQRQKKKENENNEKKKKKLRNNVLLTGATGFVGKFVLLEMLKRLTPSYSGRIKLPKNTVILCLVRKESKDRFLSRIVPKNFVKSGRVKILIGDLSEKRFGMSEEEFESLNVNVILHVGAMVNHFLPYSDHYKANVRSVYDFIELSLKQNCENFIFVSSLSVLKDPTKSIEQQKHKKIGGYAASKWACDCLLNMYYRVGNCEIFRLPLVIGDRKSGELNLKDWFTRILKFSMTHKFVPLDLDDEDDHVTNPMNMLSVDFVSEFIVDEAFVYSGKKNFDSGPPKNYNMAYRNSSMKKVFEMIERFVRTKKNRGEDNPTVKRIERVTFEEWLKKIEEIEGVLEEKVLLPFVKRFRKSKKIGSGNIGDFDKSGMKRHQKKMEGIKYEELKKYLLFIEKKK